MKVMRMLGAFLTIILLLVGCGKSVAEQIQEQLDLGNKYLEELNYEEAIIAFTKAIQIDEKQVPAYVGRGNAYVLSGETKEHLAQAQADYEKAISLDETYAEGYLGLADVYIRYGDYEKAMDVLREGLDKTGNDQKLVDKLEQMESGNITDSENRRRRMSGYDSSGALIWYIDFSYNSEGKEAGVTSYDAEGNQTGHVDVLYEGNKCVQSWGYRHGDEATDFALERIVEEYDVKGNLLSRKWYDMEGEALFSSAFEYDGAGRILKETSYDEEGITDGYTLYEYSGNTEKRSQYDSNGELWGYVVDEYDENGKMLKESRYEPDGSLMEYMINEYDTTGKRVREIRYDGAGNITSTVNFN